jgi:hypothetical protein
LADGTSFAGILAPGLYEIFGQHSIFAFDHEFEGPEQADGSWSFSITMGCNLADLTTDGTLNIDDVDAFIALATGDGYDCDDNGVTNIDDVDCFVTAFLTGCP